MSHPAGARASEKYLAMQSLDNQILIWSADTFKQHRNKRFAGHTTAGYACEVGFSPDGRFLSSGDSAGNLVVWDWKSCRIATRLKCHDKVLISHAWLPHEPVSPPDPCASVDELTRDARAVQNCDRQLGRHAQAMGASPLLLSSAFKASADPSLQE